MCVKLSLHTRDVFSSVQSSRPRRFLYDHRRRRSSGVEGLFGREPEGTHKRKISLKNIIQQNKNVHVTCQQGKTPQKHLKKGKIVKTKFQRINQDDQKERFQYQFCIFFPTHRLTQTIIQPLLSHLKVLSGSVHCQVFCQVSEISQIHTERLQSASCRRFHHLHGDSKLALFQYNAD